MLVGKFFQKPILLLNISTFGKLMFRLFFIHSDLRSVYLITPRSPPSPIYYAAGQNCTYLNACNICLCKKVSL